MPVTGINWGAFWPPTFSNIKQLFSTGGDLLQIIDDTTQEGLKQIFGTNVFGHFLMVSTTSLVNRISLIPRSSVGGSLYPIPPPPPSFLYCSSHTHRSSTWKTFSHPRAAPVTLSGPPQELQTGCTLIPLTSRGREGGDETSCVTFSTNLMIIYVSFHSGNPYASSKKLMDILSQELNRKLNDKVGGLLTCAIHHMTAIVCLCNH